MTRAHTPNAVLAVVLAICLLAVTPAAAAPGETTTGTAIGDQLGDTDQSSDGSTDEGSGSGDSSTTDSTDPSDGSDDTASSSGTTNDTSDGDSSAEPTSESDGEPSTNGTASSESNDSTTDDTSDTESLYHGSTNVTNLTNITDDVTLSTDLTESLSTTTEATDGFETPAFTDGSESGTDTTVNPTLDTETFGATSLDTTTDVVDTVDADGLIQQTGIVLGTVSVPGDETRSESTTRTQIDPARLQDASAQPRAASSSNHLSLSGSPTGATPLPPAPMTGLALGVGALAATAVARNGVLASVTLTGLGSTLTAGLAPVAGRMGMLDRLVRMLAPFRYSRYDDSDPLEHEARADVFEVVTDAPGAYLSEVAEEADIPLSTARHHIRVLEREDLVSGAKVRGKRRFYPAYTTGIELAAALNDEATAAVIDAVSRLGASSVSDLANELGRDPSTVSHHLKRLAEDDIVVRERDGRAVMNKLSPEARTALDPGRDSPAVEAGEAMASD